MSRFLTLTAIGLVLSAGAAAAQAPSFAELDHNGNGKLNRGELVRALGRDGRRLYRADPNGGRFLTEAEYEAVLEALEFRFEQQEKDDELVDVIEDEEDEVDETGNALEDTSDGQDGEAVSRKAAKSDDKVERKALREQQRADRKARREQRRADRKAVRAQRRAERRAAQND